MECTNFLVLQESHYNTELVFTGGISSIVHTARLLIAEPSTEISMSSPSSIVGMFVRGG